MSYSFKDDIEKVFDVFFNQSLLDKAGHLIKVTPKEKIINNNKTRYKHYYFYTPTPYSFEAIEGDIKIDEPHYKSCSLKLISFNDEPLQNELNVNYNFYVNSNDSSTAAVFEVVSSDNKNEELIQDYNNKFIGSTAKR